MIVTSVQLIFSRSPVVNDELTVYVPPSEEAGAQAMIVARIERGVARRVRGTARAARDMGRATATIAARLFEVLALKLLHRSDYRRWVDPRNLETWWDSRTERLAELVPLDSRVIEFGAGRRQLERHLGPRCTHVPADLVDRGPGTIVCDLNRRPFPDLRALRMDVAVFGGVLEYIIAVPALVEWLAQSVRFCVASYARVTSGASLLERAQDRFQRVRHGYMNHFTEEQFVALFQERGFVCRTRRTWESQSLFLFEKRDPDQTPALPTGASC
jgi:hypothetical protein